MAEVLTDELENYTESNSSDSTSGLVDILGFSKEELEKDLEDSLGLESFRANQLIQWLYRYRKTDFNEMTNISKSVRAQLASRYRISRPKLAQVQQSIDGTRKYLFTLEDGSSIESVLIKQEKRNTLCVSSQVGCAIGCKFCRTALMGLKRSLKVQEIVGQVLAVQDDVAFAEGINPEDYQFKNIVFMGMGEPLHNVKNVIPAVQLLNEPLGLEFSKRKITVSTSGLVPAIKKFGESGVDANLAVSLNATSNEVRDVIMPLNRKYPLEVLLKALEEYPLKPRQKITLEYVMLRDVNDTEADLKRLPGLIKNVRAKVNLIPYNQNSGLGFNAPLNSNIDHWQRTLLNQGINSTVRWSKGMDIDAACGQLAVKKEDIQVHVS